jgi:hypothetical protein
MSALFEELIGQGQPASTTATNDETFAQVLALATDYVTRLADLAESERLSRPGLSDVLESIADRHAAVVLELAEWWPS